MQEMRRGVTAATGRSKGGRYHADLRASISSSSPRQGYFCVAVEVSIVISAEAGAAVICSVWSLFVLVGTESLSKPFKTLKHMPQM